MKIERIRAILEFYSNGDNYWSAPLALENKYCRRTLQDVREAEKSNEILVDRGNLAKEALKLLDKKSNISEVGASLLIYTGNLKFEKAPPCFPVELGTSDFMYSHYYREASYPLTDNDEITPIVTHYQLKNEHSGTLPPHVLDLKVGEGNILCFNEAWEVAEYIVSLKPFIQMYLDWDKRSGI